MSAKNPAPESNLEEVLQHFPSAQKNGAGWKALCPAHADKNPSLSINQKNGKILLKCHAGCTQEAVLAAIGELRKKLSPSRTAETIVATYDYHDEDGNLLFQVVRYAEPKDFKQRRPNGNGGWIWNMKGVRRVLYHLRGVLVASELMICEGEKDVDTAWKLGFVATCNSGGAGKWKDEYSESLRGKSVTIVADADEPGRNHAKTVAISLHGKAASVKLFEMPEAKDLTEWAERGGTRESLRILIESAPEWTWVEQKNVLLLKFELSDAGNAERLVEACGNDLRYCYEKKAWFVWDGKRWLEDKGQRARVFMEKTMRQYVLEVAESGDKDAIQFAAKCLDTYRITNGLREAEKKLGVNAAQLDSHPFLLTFKNGTLDLENGKLLQHKREHLITKMIHFDYKPEAECSRFLSLLQESVGKEAIEYIQKLCGYSLTGDTSEKSFYIVWGPTNTGKTTFLEILRRLCAEYAVLLQVDTLIERRGNEGGASEDLASLRGTRLATTSELDRGRRLSIAMIKRIVQGQGEITTAAKWEKKITFNETHKLWFDTNYLPTIPSEEEAIWNRLTIIVFANQVPKEKQLKDLSSILIREEGEGILAWAVQGELLRRKNGLGEAPEKFTQEKKKWAEKMDAIQQFIAECCVIGKQSREKCNDLYQVYVAWVGADHAMSRKSFTPRLAKLGFKLDDGRRHYCGLALIEKPEEVKESTDGKTKPNRSVAGGDKGLFSAEEL